MPGGVGGRRERSRLLPDGVSRMAGVAGPENRAAQMTTNCPFRRRTLARYGYGDVGVDSVVQGLHAPKARGMAAYPLGPQDLAVTSNQDQ